MTNKLFDDIQQGLLEAEDFINNQQNVKTTKLSIKPLPDYSVTEIKAIRKKLGMSQRDFSGLLGVSQRTVESWESGINTPSGSAMRLMEIYNAYPELKNEIYKSEDI